MKKTLFRLVQDTHLFLPEASLYLTRQELGIESLWPAECSLVQNWSPQRIAQFAAGRACLRVLLQAMGREAQAILINPQKAPALPDEFVGTVSHAAGLVGAVLAPSDKVRSVALDIELLGEVQEDMWYLLLHPLSLLGCKP